MEIVAAIIFGLILGAGARLLMPGPDPLGLLGTMALGAIVAGIGYLLALQIGLGSAAEGFAVSGLCIAVASSLGALFLYRSYAMSGAA